MQKASTRTLYHYWNELRGSRSAPERREIDPTMIRSALGNTFILESNDGIEFDYRLAGSHLCTTYCRELKGRSFTGLWQNRDRDAVDTLIRAVTEDHAVAVITMQGKAGRHHKATFELILLPLRHAGNTMSRMIGAMTALDDPYWLGTDPILEQRVTGLRLIWPDDVSMPDMSEIVSEPMVQTAGGGHHEHAPMPVKVQGISARRYQHLAVIDGGKH